MKSIFKVLITIAIFLIGLVAIAINDSNEVLIESKESKTILANPVFNKIKQIQLKDKDIWMMNQSHHGSSAKMNSWDRLAIVVDKTKSPQTARYYQLEPGALEWQENLQEKPFRVACFMCHNNGPRAIRANYGSPFSPTPFKDKIKIMYWNLKIKFYGRILADPIHENQDKVSQTPFQWRGAYESQRLEIATCVHCHKKTGLLARGFLQRQQLPTIKFMLESGQMPPLGFSLSTQEKNELEKFLIGF